ncbi:hypothetical protein VMUT_0837 [Vulcanisaeta moutnovskia 768-28]|uniref:Uncharacterized protein n=1 Tax=Vulcanisaeta moutnovskia (strain 768-28) TaxID=985053 RepID=F0QWJ9_VULM7|nr:hypothetical protein VMUT_0837 [Vulcanisaeta moutnovskia 768-28]
MIKAMAVILRIPETNKAITKGKWTFLHVEEFHETKPKEEVLRRLPYIEELITIARNILSKGKE